MVSDQNHPSLAKNPKIALIMKGGGMKGIAYIGAIQELQKHYCFDLYAGTSAGAERWSRLSEQIFRVAKWSLCRG
jgi:predicted patatin/cPLA2 family phospholipase